MELSVLRKEVIPIGILTYRRPKHLWSTLESFVRMNLWGMDNFTFVFIVQDVDDETRRVISKQRRYTSAVHAYHTNLGCGWGYNKIAEKCCAMDTEFVMILEDDWLALETLYVYLDWIKLFFAMNTDVGSIRLRSDREVSASWWRNRFTKESIKYKRFMTKNDYPEIVDSDLRTIIEESVPYQFLKADVENTVRKTNAHFTTNPCIVRSDVLREMIPIKSEFDMAEKYNEMGLMSAQLQANCFRHIGHKRAFSGARGKWSK